MEKYVRRTVRSWYKRYRYHCTHVLYVTVGNILIAVHETLLNLLLILYSLLFVRLCGVCKRVVCCVDVSF